MKELQSGRLPLVRATGPFGCAGGHKWGGHQVMVIFAGGIGVRAALSCKPPKPPHALRLRSLEHCFLHFPFSSLSAHPFHVTCTAISIYAVSKQTAVPLDIASFWLHRKSIHLLLRDPECTVCCCCRSLPCWACCATWQHMPGLERLTPHMTWSFPPKCTWCGLLAPELSWRCWTKSLLILPGWTFFAMIKLPPPRPPTDPRGPCASSLKEPLAVDQIHQSSWG